MLNNYTDVDAERGFISSTRDEDGSSLDIWAYALEKGITEDHFTEQSHQEYFIAFKQADAEGDFGSIGALTRVNKDFHNQYLGFMDTLLCCDTTLHGKHFVDRLINAKKFRRLQRMSLEITDAVESAQKNTDPTDIARMVEEIGRAHV